MPSLNGVFSGALRGVRRLDFHGARGGRGGGGGGGAFAAVREGGKREGGGGKGREGNCVSVEVTATDRDGFREPREREKERGDGCGRWPGERETRGDGFRVSLGRGRGRGCAAAKAVGDKGMVRVRVCVCLHWYGSLGTLGGSLGTLGGGVMMEEEGRRTAPVCRRGPMAGFQDKCDIASLVIFGDGGVGIRDQCGPGPHPAAVLLGLRAHPLLSKFRASLVLSSLIPIFIRFEIRLKIWVDNSVSSLQACCAVSSPRACGPTYSV